MSFGPGARRRPRPGARRGPGPRRAAGIDGLQPKAREDPRTSGRGAITP